MYKMIQLDFRIRNRIKYPSYLRKPTPPNTSDSLRLRKPGFYLRQRQGLVTALLRKNEMICCHANENLLKTNMLLQRHRRKVKKYFSPCPDATLRAKEFT